jgi:GntR family transcriptional regulator / MocR family aminotransferase
VVLEDDYDAEFRYDRRPVATLQGMDPSRVCLFGSLSKTMAPALRIGWLVAPPRWTSLLRRPAVALSGPPVLDQLAFAEFVESGAYDRHVRTSRQRYRRRRDALVAALGRRLPECRVTGAAAGLHLLLHLPHGVEAGAAVGEALRLGVETASLEAYGGGGGCLVLGYGNLGDAEVEPAVDVLASALDRFAS